MSRFAILEWPPENDNKGPVYRGLERKDPPAPPDVPPIPELWTWYASYGDDYIFGEKKAIEFIRKYEYLDNPYDLVRIEQEYKPRGKDRFLGIDVASFGGYLALKSTLLYWWEIMRPERRSGLIEVICRYFIPRLNENKLFHDEEDAALFTRVVKDIQSSKIGYVEPDYNFTPHFLYLVDLNPY